MCLVISEHLFLAQQWREREKIFTCTTFPLQNAVYKGEFTATHPTVRLFWEVFHEFPLEKKKQFLCKRFISSWLQFLMLSPCLHVWNTNKDVQVVPWVSWDLLWRHNLRLSAWTCCTLFWHFYFNNFVAHNSAITFSLSCFLRLLYIVKRLYPCSFRA